MTRHVGSRLHWSGYAKIMRLLVDGQVSWPTVNEACNIERRETTHRILYKLRASGLAHIAAWEMDNGDARSRRPAFTFGPGVDVPRPGGERYRGRGTPAPEMLAFIVAVRALQDEPLHGKGLADLTGQIPRTARNLLKALHAERLVHIDHYQDRGRFGAGAPLYAWAPGEPDAKKPRPQTLKALWTKRNNYRATRNATARVMRALAGSSLRSSCDGLGVLANK